METQWKDGGLSGGHSGKQHGNVKALRKEDQSEWRSDTYKFGGKSR